MNQDSALQKQWGWVSLHSWEDTVRLALLAEGIWYAHYTPIVGSAQIRHMFETMHSPRKIGEWMEDPHAELAAISLSEKDAWIGYVLLKHADPEPGSTLLSKFYLVPAMRGRGFGAAVLTEICERSLRAGSKRLWLTANRHNHAANRAYERLGFRKSREWAQEIGGGYVMDDFVWEREVRA